VEEVHTRPRRNTVETANKNKQRKKIFKTKISKLFSTTAISCVSDHVHMK